MNTNSPQVGTSGPLVRSENSSLVTSHTSLRPASKTLAVTIGIGNGWRELAERSAARMTRFTGLPCQVISSCHLIPPDWNPSWAKAYAFDLVPEDIDRLLIFDADIYCVADFPEWNTSDPLAVVRHLSTGPVKTEMTLYGFAEYWNGGLLVIDRLLADTLRTVATYGPRYGTWLEQDALNRVFEFTDKAWLPGRCNHLLAPPGRGADPDTAIGSALGAIEAGATCLHFSGYGGGAAQIHRIYDHLDQLL
jgi:hypothetical protein